MMKAPSRSRAVKLAIYRAARAAGLFEWARRRTARQLRILCFHGIAVEDEHIFRPGLFMRPQVLQRRLDTLSRHRHPILSLEQAVDALEDGSIPDCATVITFDDGFYNNTALARPILEKFGVPWTVYVTSYHVKKGTPIFRLVLQYSFAMTTQETMSGADLIPTLQGIIDLRDRPRREQVLWEIIAYGEAQLNEEGRLALGREVAERLGISFDRILRKRLLSLMTPQELRELACSGVDVQLHTHRHRLPAIRTEVQREIHDNRAVLEEAVGRPMTHLCYPEGLWSPELWPWLEELGIRSATTCDRGLNPATAPRLGLNRFLDGEHVSQVEFEAELSGFSELLRRARSASRVRGL